MFFRAIRLLSIGAIIGFSYVCILNEALIKDNYHTYSFMTVYTKARKLRDVWSAIYQVTIVLSYLIGLSFVVRPLILVSVLHVILNNLLFIYLFISPIAEKLDNEIYNDPESSKWARQYLLTNKRVRPVPGETDNLTLDYANLNDHLMRFSLPGLVCLSFLMVALHWTVNGMKTIK